MSYTFFKGHTSIRLSTNQKLEELNLLDRVSNIMSTPYLKCSHDD